MILNGYEPSFRERSKPIGEVQELLFFWTQRVVGALIWGVRGHRRTGHRVHVIRVVLGDGGWQDAGLERRAHRVMLIQKLLERADVLHSRAQRLHFAHLLVRRSVGNVFAESSKAVVYQLYPVAFSLVPPGHRVRLLLGHAVPEAGEAEPPFAPEQLRRGWALPLRLLRRGLVAALAVGRTELDALRCKKAGRWHELLMVYAYFHLGSDVHFAEGKKGARKSTKVFFGMPSGRASCSWRSRVASMGRGAPDSRPALSFEMETSRPFQYAGGSPRVPPDHAPRDALALRTPGACRSCHWVNNFL